MTYSEALKVFGLNSINGITEEEFKVMYRKLAREKHPDTNNGSSKDFVLLREAFDYLREYGSFHEKRKSRKKDKQANITEITTIDTLSKDEVVRRYKEDRKVLENQLEVFEQSINAQEDTMIEIRNVVEKLMGDYENEKKKLQIALDYQIESLEAKYKPSFFKQLLFFLPKMSKKEFWNKYNESVSIYTSRYESLNLSFFKIMVATYGEGLNKISQNLENKNN
jgi:curved DNA-binding protein CbpA